MNAAVFICLEIAAISMLKNASPLQSIWVSRVSHRVMAGIWGGSETIKYYFSLKDINDSIAAENTYLKERLTEFEEMEKFAERDSIFREFPTFGDFEYIPASVIKISRNRQHNYFIINKGYEDGINAQSGVITAKGAIGIVDAVEKHYSYCISFMNPSSSISARLGKEGAVGPLIWNGISTDKAILKEIPLQSKFEPGDTVWTSGYSSIFPPDIPLGITGESKVVNGAVREIKVELFQDFSAVRYVSVVNNYGRDEIINLEQMELDSHNEN